jgi:hypothetical protein
VELKLPRDADDSETREVPLLNVSSNYQSSVEAHSSSRSFRQQILRRPFRRPGSRSSGQAARSTFSPQIGPLDFGGDVTVYFPSQVFLEEPSSNQITHSSFLSEPSSSRAVHVRTGTRDDRNIHQLTTPTFSIRTASDTSSSFEDSINMSSSSSSLAGLSVPS